VESSIADLIRGARAGEGVAIDRLLGLYRNYLRLLARASLDVDLRVRGDPSDAVQEALLRAYQGIREFRGTTEAELVAWLKRIMANHLADHRRRHGAQVRDHARERPLDATLDRSSLALRRLLGAGGESPSAFAHRREQEVLVADALAELGDDAREVIVLRSLQELEWADVGRRMARSPDAARVLWARALRRLGKILRERGGEP